MPTSTSSPSTTSARSTTMAHLLKYDSVLGILPNKVKAHRRPASRSTATSCSVLSERNPAELPWGDLGVDVVVESTGIFTSSATRPRPPRGGRPAGHRVRAVRRRRRHVRVRRQPQRLRPQEAQGDLQRQLHDELLRADGQGARRRVRRRAGPDDRPSTPTPATRCSSTARTATCAGPAARRSTSSRRAPARRAPRRSCWRR